MLGDKTRVELLQGIASATGAKIEASGDERAVIARRSDRELQLVATADDRATGHARIASRADLAILVVDATQGPLPIHREHVLLARQMAVPELWVLFTHSRQVDDPELLELEELEIRELLNLYGMRGDTACFAVDSATAKVDQRWSGPRGVDSLLQSIAGISARAFMLPAAEHAAARAELYVLADRETFARGVADAVRAGPATMLIAGEEIIVQLFMAQPLAPASSGGIQIEFPVAVRHAAGQRFALLRGGHVTAVGVLISDAP